MAGQVQRARLVKWSSAVAVAAVTGLFIWGLLVSRSGPGVPGAGGVTLPDFYGLAGQTAPNFTLRDVANMPVSLSDFRGKRVLVNFWYADCPGCATEAPDLEKFYAQAQQQQMVILGVNIEDDAHTASQFMQQFGITYPVVLDTHQQVLDLYHLTSTPSSVFVDSQGVIRGSVSGTLTATQLQAYFSAIH
jgi:peroxiredoxin